MIPDKAATDARLKIWKTKSKTPTPGWGWCGWYKGWYFRSLRELSFVIEVLEKSHKIWETGENPKYQIPYVDLQGVSRNYFPDFVLTKERIIVECKPISQWKDPLVCVKKAAAAEFCAKKGYKFRMIDPVIIDEQKLKQLYKAKVIKFVPETDKKFKKQYRL